MMRIARSLTAAALLLTLTSSAAFCDEYYSNQGFSIDLPEGFIYLEGDGSTKFSFGTPDESVRVDILVYPPSRFVNAKTAAADTASKLSGRGTFSSFEFGGSDAALGELVFGSGAAALKGYGLFVNDASPLPAADGAGARSTASSRSTADAYDLVVLAYSSAADYENNRDLVESAMDGLSANVGRRAVPGPLGAVARIAIGAGGIVSGGTSSTKPPVVPGAATQQKTVTIPFGAANIQTDWNPREGSASQVLVEREYRVLSAYAQSPELLDAAIARFYRMIFRDAAPALDKLSLALSAAWETGAWAGAKWAPSLAAPLAGSPPTAQLSADPQAKSVAAAAPTTKPTATSVAGPRFGAAAEPRAYAEALLAWVQGFRYERDPKGSDVVNPISAAFESRGDCDSRALVMAILLRRENIRSILMISLEYEHALAAIDAPGAGARYPFLGKNWLVAETTAKVGIGLVDQTQADPASWIGVDFPF